MLVPVKRRHNRENFVLAANALRDVAAFPFFGTLLGIIRERDIIKNDDDVDFYVDSRHREEAISRLTESGFSISLDKWPNESPFFLQATRLIEGIETFVDLYFYDFNQESSWITERWNFIGRPEIEGYHIYLNKDLIFPLKKSIFLDVEIFLPRHPRKCCAYLYGPSWREKKSKHRGEYKIFVHQNRPIFVNKGTDFYDLMQWKSEIENKISQLKSSIELFDEDSNLLITAESDDLGTHFGLSVWNDNLVALNSKRNATLQTLRADRERLEDTVNSLSNRIEELTRKVDELTHFSEDLTNFSNKLGQKLANSRAQSALLSIQSEHMSNFIAELESQDKSLFSRRIAERHAAVREMIERDSVSRLILLGFDKDFYLRTNADIALSDIDPLRHYLRQGRVEDLKVRFDVTADQTALPPPNGSVTDGDIET